MFRFVVVVVLALAALTARAEGPAPPAPSGTTRVLIVDFIGRGVDGAVVGVIADDIAMHLQRDARFAVATTADVRTMLRVAGDRQLLGCVGEEACMAGVAALLEARHVVRGVVAATGGALTLTLTHLDTGRAAAVSRTTETASDFEGLRKRTLLLADDVAESIIETVAPRADTSGERRLRTRADCVWAAVHTQRGKQRGGEHSPATFTAHFDAAHFSFDEFDRLRKALPVSRRLLFPGDFPSCLGRTEATQDSFVLESGRSLVLPVQRGVATALEGSRKDRKLRLELVFEVIDARLQPLPAPDPVLCGRAGVTNIPELAPEMTIRVTGGVLVDELHGKRFSLAASEGDALTFAPLPSTP